MKKQYIKPEVEVVELDKEITVMMNSGGLNPKPDVWHNAGQIGSGWKGNGPFQSDN